MIGSALATLLVALLAMMPGALAVRGRVSLPGQMAAAACASLIFCMLATAILGVGWHLLAGGAWPAWTLAPVALVAGIIALLGSGRPAAKRPSVARLEWQGLLFAGTMVVFGFASQAMAVRHGAGGALFVHAWYNADWFKHLGHVAALADFGIPARDVFDGGAPLHYYWLTYLLPGAGAAIGGDAWTALTVANAVFVALLCMTLYGAIRLATRSPWLAMVGGISTFFAIATTRMMMLLLAGTAGRTMTGTSSPDGPELLAFAQYLPQHALTLAALLAWLLLDRPDARAGDSWRRRLGLAGLVPALAMSTLLGALTLSTYGILQLWRRRREAIVEVVGMALCSLTIVFVLGVIAIDATHGALKTPMLAAMGVRPPLGLRMVNDLAQVVARLGLPLLLAVAVLWSNRRAQPAGQTDNRRFAAVALVVGICGPAFAEAILAPQVAFEVLLRAPSIAVFGIAITLADWFGRSLPDRRKRRIAISLFALFWIVALPSAVLRTVWHGKIGDRFTTVIPAEDLAVLHTLKDRSDPDAIVLQYPERPYLASPPGRDTWTPLIAQRAIVTSRRATDYAGALPELAQLDAFFAGRPVPIPAAADWVYLSRTLHPASFDLLSRRMRAEPDWSEVTCNPGACLFARANGSRR